MKILLTGGCGYIGTVLTQALLEDGHDVISYDIKWFGDHLPQHPRLRNLQGDIRDIAKVPMDGVEVILHLANVANDPCGDLNSKLVWEVNALASQLLVEKAIKHGVKQFVFASSGSVYGVKDEDQVTEELELLPISDYNKTKMVSERVLLSYKDQILVQCVRPATVCGVSPRMRLDVSVNMLTVQALKNKKITVFGGDQTRPNIHIKDMVRIYQHIIAKGPSMPGIFNAGFENMSILEIAQAAAKRTGAEIIVTPSNDPRSYRLNSDKLLNTGFAPKYGVEYAMDEITEAYNSGRLKDEEIHYNLKIMKKIANLQ